MKYCIIELHFVVTKFKTVWQYIPWLFKKFLFSEESGKSCIIGYWRKHFRKENTMMGVTLMLQSLYFTNLKKESSPFFTTGTKFTDRSFLLPQNHESLNPAPQNILFKIDWVLYWVFIFFVLYCFYIVLCWLSFILFFSSILL